MQEAGFGPARKLTGKIQTSASGPPGTRFHGGRYRRSRFRSSHAASWAESQTTASTRAIRATIGAR